MCAIGYNSVYAKASCSGKNKRYVVSEIIDLKGKELSLPAKTVLVFKGCGKFVNGRVSGKNIKIVSGNHYVFASNVTTYFEETKLRSNWFECLYACIIDNRKCKIIISEGNYIINNKPYAKITNSLIGEGEVRIKHISPFSVGDEVLIDGISWDGQDKANYWMYCQPNHLIIRNCTFQNYYGKSAGIIYWSHSERDTDGLIIENCTFGRLGAKENGVVGDMDGSTAVIYTYRCKNIEIRNNKFSNQFGEEDSDAIKLEGIRVSSSVYPKDEHEIYVYSDINARIERNVFINVPKSPIKLFASRVIVRNNKMTYNNRVKTALARVFNGRNLIIERNKAICNNGISNVVEVLSCKNVCLYKNRVESTDKEEYAFGELIKIENSNDICVDKMNIFISSSSRTDVNQTLVRLSGRDIKIRDSNIKAPYTYYGIYAPFGVIGLTVENSGFSVNSGIQHLLLVNNTVSDAKGKCIIMNSVFNASSQKINSATSYGAIFAHEILVDDCRFNYDKEITLNADNVDVKRSRASRFNIQQRGIK